MKPNLKKIVVILLLVLFSCKTFSQEITNEKYYEYMQALINDRAVVFNSLNLSEKQKTLYEQITKKYSQIYTSKLKELTKENTKPFPNRNITKKTEKDIAKISQKENQELESILNRIQCTKYKQIKHLRRHDIKKELHPKNYYKSNPQMEHFGNPK